MFSSSSHHPRLFSAFLAALLALGLGGCAGPQLPKNSEPTSAMVDGYHAIYSDSIPSSSSADVILLTSLYNVDPYQTDTLNNTEYHWKFELFQVLKVEKGQWNYATLSFICVDSYSQNSNGAGNRPWPYHSGVVYRFWLNTRQYPAHVIGQQTLYYQTSN